MAELSEIYHELDIDQQFKVKVCVGWLTVSTSVWDLALRAIDPGARGLEALDEFYDSIMEQIKDTHKEVQNEAERSDLITVEQAHLLRFGNAHLGGRKFAIDQ
ncbi:MAG: hypothetical protein AB7L09_21525 [Nitrospira sp.]